MLYEVITQVIGALRYYLDSSIWESSITDSSENNFCFPFKLANLNVSDVFNPFYFKNRITSYNVCYTKLLRYLLRQEKAYYSTSTIFERFFSGSKRPPISVEDRKALKGDLPWRVFVVIARHLYQYSLDVITSYSIHYTKLYEANLPPTPEKSV